MDDLIWFFIIIAAASLFERIMKAARQKQQGRPSIPQETEESEGEEVRSDRAPVSVTEMLAEHLGLNLERHPQVLPPPEPFDPEAPQATAAAPPPPGTVVYPSSRTGGRPAQGSVQRAAEQAQRRREAFERRVDERRRESRLPARRTDLPAPSSRRERALRPRDAAKTLERPRRPEDHDRFHERYNVPEPVSSHTEFHERYVDQPQVIGTRRKRLKLPDRADWSAVKRAIVWAEVLGPPKGLS